METRSRRLDEAGLPERDAGRPIAGMPGPSIRDRAIDHDSINLFEYPCRNQSMSRRAWRIDIGQEVPAAEGGIRVEPDTRPSHDDGEHPTGSVEAGSGASWLRRW